MDWFWSCIWEWSIS